MVICMHVCMCACECVCVIKLIILKCSLFIKHNPLKVSTV